MRSASSRCADRCGRARSCGSRRGAGRSRSPAPRHPSSSSRHFSPNLTPMSPLCTVGRRREHRRSRPDRTGAVDGSVRPLVCGADGRGTSSPNALLIRASGAGDRIVWLGQNSFRVLECLLAAAKLGASFCPVNWRQSADEMTFVLDDLSPAVAVWQEAEIGDTVRAARAKSRRPEPRWVQHDGGEYEALVASGSADEPDLDGRSGCAGDADVHRRVLRPAERGDAVAHRARRPGAHDRPAGRDRRQLRVPELRTAVPHRDVLLRRSRRSCTAAPTCSRRASTPRSCAG